MRSETEMKEQVAQATDGTDRKNRFGMIIGAVTRSIHQSLNLQYVFESTVEALGQNISNADYIGIYLVEGEEAVLKSHRNLPDSFIRGAGRIPYPNGKTWKTIIEGKSFYCPDTEQDTIMGPAGRELETKSYLSIPIHSKGKVIGAININSLKKNAFDEDELKLLEILAQQIEIAINNANQMEALRESEANLATELADAEHLQKISVQLIQQDNVNVLYEQILDAAIALMCSDMGSLQMLYPEKNELLLLVWKGFKPASAAFWECVRVDSGSSCGAALHTGRRVIFSDVETCDFMAGTEDLDYYRLSGIRAVQSTPLISRSGHIVGMISTHWRKPHQPSERNLRLFDVLARQAADLIERRKTEEALHRAIDFDEAIMTSMGEGLYTVDNHGLVTMMNPAAEKLFGWTLEELRGKKMHDVTHYKHPDGSPFPAEECAGLEVLRQGKIMTDHEDVFIRKDGTFFNVVYSSSPIREKGEITGLVVVFRDISKHKQTEEKLRESEEFNRSIFESSGDCINVLDLDGNLLAMNSPGACLMEIDDFSRFAGGCWIDFWPEEEKEALREAVEVAKAGGTGNFSRFCPTAKGTPKWWDVVITPVRDTQGKVVRLVSTSRDITGHKRAEELLRESETRFHMLADNMSQLVWICVNMGEVIWYNARWLDYTGLTFEDMKGWGWTRCHHPDHVDRVIASVTRSSETGEVWEDTFPLRGRDGRYRWFLSRAVPIRDAGGNIVHWFGTNTDITERLEIEAALSESEMRFRELADTAPVAVFVCDLDGVIQYYNPHAVELWGREPACGVERHCGSAKLWLPGGELLPHEQSPIVDVLRTGIPVHNVEVLVERPDGSLLPVLVNFAAMKNAEGAITGAITCFQNITERKQVEEALRRSHEELEIKVQKRTVELSKKNRYEVVVSAIIRSVHQTIGSQTVIENAVEAMSGNIESADYVAIYMVETDSTGSECAVLKAHSGYSDQYTKRAGRIAYPKGATWKSIIDDKPIYCADTDKDPVIGPAGRDEGIKSYLSIPIHFEDKVIGAINITSLNKNAFDSEEIKLLEVVAQQIEAAMRNARWAETLRQSEERYRKLFDQSSVGVFIFDRELVITDCNRRFVEILGASYDGLIGLDLKKIKDKSFKPTMEEALKGRDSHREGFYEATSSTKRLWLSVHYSPLFDAEGNVTGGMGVVEDITERKRAEEERLKLDKLESVGVLAGGIAHDFNNLISAIFTTISHAKMNTPTKSGVYENLVEAENACRKAKKLTQQLLTFSKGGTPVRRLASLAEIIKESSGFVLRGSKSRCDFSFSDGLWNVEVDEGQINQVIHNLIINAEQAMPQGGEIRVTAENANVEAESSLPLQSGRYVKITMEDKGVGIPKGLLSKIFDPYFTTKQKGSGLGLATVYSIIKGHKGYIEAESELGVGTKFFIYLSASQERLKKKRASNKARALRRKPDKKKKVLLMDDEALINLATGKALADLGYDVEYATDGSEATEMYKSALKGGKPFDVVIMDLTIPGGMGGKETVEKLIEIDPEVKAIVSSGYSDDPVMSEFGDYGFKGVIAKPYEIKELAEAINKVIGS